MRFYTGWVTSDRVEPAAGPAMSASHPKRPSAMKMRSVAKGQTRTYALQQRAVAAGYRTTLCYLEKAVHLLRHI